MAMPDDEQAYIEIEGHRLYRWFVHCRNRELPLIAWGESEKAVKDQVTARGEHVLLIEPEPSADIK